MEEILRVHDSLGYKWIKFSLSRLKSGREKPIPLTSIHFEFANKELDSHQQQVADLPQKQQEV